MASTHAKAVRRADALRRLSGRLGVQQADLHANAKGDAEMALIMTLERIADALDAQGEGTQQDKPASSAEAVAQVEAELEAETGKDFVQTSEAPPVLAETSKPKGKGKS